MGAFILIGFPSEIDIGPIWIALIAPAIFGAAGLIGYWLDRRQDRKARENSRRATVAEAARTDAEPPAR